MPEGDEVFLRMKTLYFQVYRPGDPLRYELGFP
jgi:hypothetical protein